MTEAHQTKETLQVMSNTILSALKANIAPGLVLFALEGVLIFSYYQCEPCNPAFTWLSELKSDWGYLYSALATSLFGGFLPWCIGLATNEVLVTPNWKLTVLMFATPNTIQTNFLHLRTIDPQR